MDKLQEISSFVDKLKSEVIAKRSIDIKENIEKNINKSLCITQELEKSSKEIDNTKTNILFKRMRDAMGMSTHVVLPLEEPVPPFITWVFLSRNHGMRDDQSMESQRNLYYDDCSGETFVCGSIEDQINDATIKREFLKFEDHILSKTITTYGCQSDVINILAKCLKREANEVEERYEVLLNKETIAKQKESDEPTNDIFEKNLDVVMDAYDKLFCRRCYAFNCRTHGPPEDLILPVDKQLPWCPTNEENIPCSPNCFKLGESEEKFPLLPWTPFEEALYNKCVKIFDKNSCLIANMLNGQKTCWEIHQYGLTNTEGNREKKEESKGEGPKREMSGLKFSLYNSNNFSSYTPNEKCGLFPHYVPCKCTTSCSKHCPCFKNWPCDKYCGCPKTCNLRYRGCSCRNGQCSSDKCSCFTSKRECDPDLCLNCKVGCGDGSLGYFSPEGHAHGCNNMKFLLRQHQKIILGISDVSGWGAFVKDDVGKDEFLGEYTGEIISNEEADMRGTTLYDQINKSYLFNLDNQFVIDAYRKGDKLKFVNHSPTPNCYPKIIKVGGDYRVGLYSNKEIKSGTEIFFDYNYLPENCPEWARELLQCNQKKKKDTLSNGSIKKHARKGALPSRHAKKHT